MEPLSKATPRVAREHNVRLVLTTIYDAGLISRADVARHTKLTRTTVSEVVDGLIADGLVREVGRGPSTGGKAPILLAVPDDARLLVGVDLGDRTFVGAVVNLRGEILHHVEVPSEDADGPAALELAMSLIDEVLGAAPGPVLGIGIGAPGLVDPTSGTVIQGVRRSWHGLALGAEVAARFGLPVHVANDSQAAALAEHVFGASRASNLIVIKVGEGIGAGIVLGGSLFEGDGFGAGEIGHTVVDPSGSLCRCGRRGCLETVASVRAIHARLADRQGAHLRPGDVVERLRRGDLAVTTVVVEAATRLGQSVGALIGALHVRRIVLTGPAAAFGTPWLEAVRAAARSSALATLADDTSIELGGDDDVVVLGASALLMTRELGLSLHPRGPIPRPRPVEPPVEPREQAVRIGLVPADRQRGGDLA